MTGAHRSGLQIACEELVAWIIWPFHWHLGLFYGLCCYGCGGEGLGHLALPLSPRRVVWVVLPRPYKLACMAFTQHSTVLEWPRHTTRRLTAAGRCSTLQVVSAIGCNDPWGSLLSCILCLPACCSGLFRGEEVSGRVWREVVGQS